LHHVDAGHSDHWAFLYFKAWFFRVIQVCLQNKAGGQPSEEVDHSVVWNRKVKNVGGETPGPKEIIFSGIPRLQHR
jgi:predicted Rdx family selenoprotein